MINIYNNIGLFNFYIMYKCTIIYRSNIVCMTSTAYNKYSENFSLPRTSFVWQW